MNPIEVDARGLRCPLPVIRLAEAARDAPAGTVITLLTSDPAARHDVPAWCRMRDHQLREVTEASNGSPTSKTSETSGETRTEASHAAGADPAYLRFVVVIRPQPAKAAGAGSNSARWSRAM